MAKETKELEFNDKYRKRLYETLTERQLAQRFFAESVDFDTTNYDSFSKKFTDIVKTKNKNGKIINEKLYAIHETDLAYLCRLLYVRYKRLTQDSKFELNLENILDLFNHMLADNWELYCSQKSKRAEDMENSKTQQEEDEFYQEPVPLMEDIVRSYKKLVDRIDLYKIDSLSLTK